jgi:hypothetical protein
LNGSIVAEYPASTVPIVPLAKLNQATPSVPLVLTNKTQSIVPFLKNPLTVPIFVPPETDLYNPEYPVVVTFNE